jgi:hypothetical protein
MEAEAGHMTADRLRSDIQALRPGIANGSVIRFVSRNQGTGIGYTYCGLFANGQWYLTGSDRSPFPRTCSHVDLLELLAGPRIEQVATALTWEWVS